MIITIKQEGDILEGVSEQIKGFAEKIAIEMGQAQIANIRRRTEAGIGLDDAPMLPYSAAYRKIRIERGRNGSPRTLLFSGKMLRAMRSVYLINREYSIINVIGFTDSESNEKAGYNQKRSPWLGISGQDKIQLMSFLSRIKEGK